MDILIYIGFAAAAINLIIITMIIALISRGKSLSSKHIAMLLDISLILILFGIVIDVAVESLAASKVSVILYSIAVLLGLVSIVYLPKEIFENGKNN